MYHSVKVLIALLFKSYTKDQEINDKSEATIFFGFFRKCYLFHFLRHQLFVDPAWGTCATTIFQILQYDISFSEIQSVITPLNYSSLKHECEFQMKKETSAVDLIELTTICRL